MPYDEIDAVNYSTLKWMRVSPLHYKHARDNRLPDRDPFRVGRAVHCAVFEPGKFLTDFVAWDRVTKGGKSAPRNGKAWDAFQEEHAHQTILTMSQMREATAIGEAVWAHPLARVLLEDKKGIAEQELTWEDPRTGLACKARLDWIAPTYNELDDLKTCGTGLSPRTFGRTVDVMGYALQLAHYRRGAKAVLGLDLQPGFILVEKTPPYDVAVRDLGDDSLDVAEHELDELLVKLAGCIDKDEWPGAYQERGIQELPTWRIHGEEEDVGALDVDWGGGGDEDAS